MEPKKVTVGGKEYALRRFTLKDRAVINSTIIYEMDPDAGRMVCRFTPRHMIETIVRGIESPKLTEAQVEAMSDEEGSALHAAVLDYNARPLSTRAPLSPPTAPEG